MKTKPLKNMLSTFIRNILNPEKGAGPNYEIFQNGEIWYFDLIHYYSEMNCGGINMRTTTCMLDAFVN